MPPAMQINLNAADVADVTACPFAAALLIAVIVATCFTLFAIMKKVFTITERMRLQDDIINATLLATTMYNVYMFYSNLTASYLDDLPAFQAVASSMLNLSFLTLLHYLLPDGDPTPRAILLATITAVLLHLGTFSVMLWSVTGWKE